MHTNKMSPSQIFLFMHLVDTFMHYSRNKIKNIFDSNNYKTEAFIQSSLNLNCIDSFQHWRNNSHNFSSLSTLSYMWCYLKEGILKVCEAFKCCLSRELVRFGKVKSIMRQSTVLTSQTRPIKRSAPLSPAPPLPLPGCLNVPPAFWGLTYQPETRPFLCYTAACALRSDQTSSKCWCEHLMKYKSSVRSQHAVFAVDRE